jgi:hypothetical protein
MDIYEALEKDNVPLTQRVKGQIDALNLVLQMLNEEKDE